MIQEIVSNIVQSCVKIIAQEHMQEFSRIVALELGKYDITEKHYEIVPADEQINKGYMMYFVAKKIEGLSERSIHSYKAEIDKFGDFIKKPFDKVTTDDIRYYLAVKQRDGVCEVTADTIRRVLNGFYVWLNNEGYVTRNPVYPIKAIKRKKVVRHAFTETELEKLRDCCKSRTKAIDAKRGLAIIETLLSTGCRVGELVGLKISDVDFQNKSAIVFGKGKKERRVYFTERAMMRINDYLKERGDDGEKWLFVSTDKQRNRLLISGVEIFLREIGRESGVNNVHPHKFRRTAATIALRRGMPLIDIQRMLGHESLETTKIYLDMDDSSLENQHRKFM